MVAEFFSLFLVGDKPEKFSVPWIIISLLLCAVAMLCKEQGITVLVYICTSIYLCILACLFYTIHNTIQCFKSLDPQAIGAVWRSS